MSRALNIDADRAHVLANCARLKAPVSVIETLPGGTVRLVLRTGDAAANVARAYARRIVTGPVARTPLTLAVGRSAR